MFYMEERDAAVAKAEEMTKEYNTVSKNLYNLSVELYNNRKSAANDIYAVERYINSLSNSPKTYQKDICDAVSNITRFEKNIQMEKIPPAEFKLPYGISYGLSRVVTGQTDPIGAAIVVAATLFKCWSASEENKKVAAQATAYTTELAHKIYKAGTIIAELRKLNYETNRLRQAISLTGFRSAPFDYRNFSESQKTALLSLVNNTIALGKLLNIHVG